MTRLTNWLISQNRFLRVPLDATFWDRRYAVLLTVGITALYAACDFTLPGEIMVAIFYASSVAASGWTRSRAFLWGTTLLCIALTYAGLAFGPLPTAPVMVELYINRSFVAAGLVLIAAIFQQRMTMLDRIERARDLEIRQNKALTDTEAELRRLNEELEAEVQVRTQELEHRNAELAEARARVAEVDRVVSLGVLTASIAHEVNQPIATARNNAASALRFLSRSPPDLEEVREALDCVVGDVDRAGNVISGIRKLITKSPTSPDDCFDINKAIRDVVVLSHGATLKGAVSVQMRLAEGLPLTQGDRVQVQQVILNLILNAVEAMSSVDDACRELSISTGRRGVDEILVAVRDSGPGIDTEHRERIFDSFYTTKPAGMGLGLAICRSIVDAHAGRLWAEANEPRGAVFQFTLPAGNHGS